MFYKKESSQLITNEDGSVSKQIPKPPIENAVFKGGGPRGLVYIGTILSLEKNNIYQGLKRVGGTSAGALTALVIALGYSAKEAASLLEEVDTMKLLQEESAQLLRENSTAGMIKKTIRDGYLDDGSVMLAFINKIINKRIEQLAKLFPNDKQIKVALEKIEKGENITFADLHKI